jgi:hypothetical protein
VAHAQSRPARKIDPGVIGLAACHEFLVDCEDGTSFGVVDDVVFAAGRPVALLVAVGRFGRRIVHMAPEEVVEIHPEERRLTVERRACGESGRGVPERKSR